MSGIQTRPIGVKVSMLTFCLTGLDSTKLVNLYLIQQSKAAESYFNSQTGGQPYSDTSPYKVIECSLAAVVAQLAEQSLPPSKFRGSNPAISDTYLAFIIDC